MMGGFGSTRWNWVSTKGTVEANLPQPGHISFAVIVIGSPMPRSAKIAMTERCGGPIRFACSLAESRGLRRFSLLDLRGCITGLTSAFNSLH